jgi:hypothetical protein
MKPTSILRISAALIAAVLVLGLATAARAQSALSGTWSVELTSDLATLQFGTRVDTENEHDDWSRDVAITSFAGLSREQLQSTGTNVRFDVMRDAGTLHCVGYVARGAGGGTFTFEPSASFANALATRGIAQPNAAQQLRMAMADVTIAFIDMLRRNSSAITSADDIIRVLNHGVNERYVSGLASLGYRNLGAEDLVRMRDHGVTVEYVQGMLALGYRPTVDDLVRLRDHGVTLDFVKRVKDHGYDASVEQLIRMRDAGIS